MNDHYCRLIITIFFTLPETANYFRKLRTLLHYDDALLFPIMQFHRLFQHSIAKAKTHTKNNGENKIGQLHA